MRPKASDGPRFWWGDCAGLAYQCLQTSSGLDELQPNIDSAKIAVCIDGRLDNREESIRTFSSELRADPAGLPDSSLVLGCYRRFGDSFATHLNGDFAIALFDGERRQLLLARDVMGIRPLYYWTSSTTVIAASEIKAILAHPQVETRPDDTALADLLVGGDPNELRLTCFRDVLRVLPGYTVVATRERIREFRHWDFDPTRQIRCASVTEYAEVLRGLFEQAVRRRLRSAGPVAVMVSGGLDSSGILCQAETLRQSGVPVAKAFGVSQIFPDGTPADEKRYLMDIETRYGLEIRRLLFTSFEYVDEEKLLWQTESPSMRWDTEIQCLGTARDLGCSVVLDGDYGDLVVASSAHLFELAGSFHWLQFWREFRAFAQSNSTCSPRLLRKEILLRLIRHVAPDYLMRPVRSIRRIWDADRSPRWYTKTLRSIAYQRSQQQRRPTGPFGSMQAEICYRYFHAPHVTRAFEQANKLAAAYSLEKAYPFVDRDLVAFSMAIPGEVMNWHGVYKGLYREAMRGILPESIRKRPWKADFTPLDNEAAATVCRRFQDRWGPDFLAIKHGYVNFSNLQDALSKHMGRLTGEKMLPAAQMNSLIAFEMWLQAFFLQVLPADKPGSTFLAG